MTPRRRVTWPRLGPCKDPLALWYVEYDETDGCKMRRYFASRVEARVALAALKNGVREWWKNSVRST